MVSDRQLELEKFKKISQKMLDLATVKDWGKFSELEKERSNVIESFFSQAVSVEESSQVERIINEVLLINDKITALAEKDQLSISLQRKNMKKRQNVHSAYLQNE